MPQGELFAPQHALPDGFKYRPDFITAEEEAGLLAQIGQLPLREAQYKEFELVCGLSLAGAGRMRLRRYPYRKGSRAKTLAIMLEPRSAYILRGEARWRWQHSIPPTKNLRYSITFRTRRRIEATA